jgi:hypothetical protein
MHPYGFDHPLKASLEHLLSARGDIHRAKEAIQILVGAPMLFRESGVVARALYTQALVSYVRCFTSGRRKGLDTAIFSDREDMLTAHNEFKDIRDKHVAHPVGKLEHWGILVAAKDPNSPAVGLGLQNWFYVGAPLAELKAFLKLILFVENHLDDEVNRTGDLLAKAIVGPKATWRSAERAFHRRITQEQIYPSRAATRPKSKSK